MCVCVHMYEHISLISASVVSPLSFPESYSTLLKTLTRSFVSENLNFPRKVNKINLT